jgi:hypothetical protein
MRCSSDCTPSRTLADAASLSRATESKIESRICCRDLSITDILADGKAALAKRSGAEIICCRSRQANPKVHSSNNVVLSHRSHQLRHRSGNSTTCRYGEPFATSPARTHENRNLHRFHKWKFRCALLLGHYFLTPRIVRGLSVKPTVSVPRLSTRATRGDGPRRTPQSLLEATGQA